MITAPYLHNFVLVIVGHDGNDFSSLEESRTFLLVFENECDVNLKIEKIRQSLLLLLQALTHARHLRRERVIEIRSGSWAVEDWRISRPIDRFCAKIVVVETGKDFV